MLTKLLNIIQSVELRCINDFTKQRMKLNCSMDRIIDSLKLCSDFIDFFCMHAQNNYRYLIPLLLK